jgi:Spy/CpxP family protein refolding chaperone
MSRVLRVVLFSGLFLAVPLFALDLDQRFGGAGSQRVGNAPPQQTPVPTPAGGQRSGAPGRQDQNRDSFAWEWWKDDGIKKELKLSESQVRSLTRIYETRVRELKPIADELEKQVDLQRKMARERTVEVAIFSIQANHVEALRSELNKTRSVMFYSFSRVLTPEQHTKLQDIRDKRARERTGRGGGGNR